MKAVHINPSVKVLPRSFPELLAYAKQQETDGDLPAAAAAFQQCIKLKPASEYCHDRLMIIYRKLKEYKKEAAAINAGIKAFESIYKSKTSPGKKIAALSKSILRSTGLTDAKGKSTFSPQPIMRWKNRLALLHKRHLQ